MAAAGPGLILEGVSRRYRSRQALDRVDLEVGRGRLCALVGGNGAGKTTLLRIVAGTLDPDAGRVVIDGVDRAEQPGAAAAALGYLAEGGPLPLELTVAEHLHHHAALRGVARGQRAEHVAALCRRVAVGDRAGEVIGRLSRGLRQRVALAAALAGSPPVLALDEPAAGLDEVQRAELRTGLREMSGDRTVLWSTHELSDVEAIADQVVVLVGGKVAAAGTVAEVRAAAGLGDGAPLRDVVARLEGREPA